MRAIRNSSESESLIDLIRDRNTSSALDHFDLNHIGAMRSHIDAGRAFFRNEHDLSRFETCAGIDHVAGKRESGTGPEIQRKTEFKPAALYWKISCQQRHI